MGAQVLVESSIFENVAVSIPISLESQLFLTLTQLAIVTDLDSDEDGYAVQRNNVFTNSPTEITQAGSLSSVPYTYTLAYLFHVKYKDYMANFWNTGLMLPPASRAS